ncbi:hypothetical protein EXE30_07975 [Acinetobacter halotolerans]|uniref:Type I restriction enzyme R protein N-terminal domain-containing protein n=1 Tax=Acinetobacter halotolerans TaxID=1752076 RepID=A0A4Q6XJX7_9GAMM|nr:hypothetical protein [Acinetobacter halotolerans]RZF53057.1 hypothetical protein EXE30_07975 [Acinetobacter halotolerans]
MSELKVEEFSNGGSMSIGGYSKEKIKDLLSSAKTSLNNNDQELLILGGNEQSLVFRLGVYLHQQLEKDGAVALDSEYTKHAKNPKLLNERIIRPDLVIHQRGHDIHNLVVIECKRRAGYQSKKAKSDIDKLKKLTTQGFGYGYRVGVFLNFKNESVEATFIQNGEIVTGWEKVVL